MAGKPGGGTKFTPLTRQRLLEALERGLTINLACQTAGVSHDSFQRWRAKDASFASELKEAEGRRADRWLAFIEAAAPRHWGAAAWLLERCHPQEYGRHLLGQPEVQYDEATVRALAVARGIDPDQLVAAVAQAQAAQQATRQASRPANAPIPLHARGTRFAPVSP